MDNVQGKRIAFATLGCRLNQFETDALTGDFLRAGWRVVGFDEDAELYVINTCTITGKGEQKSRNLVNRARRRQDAHVVVTGCSVETAGEYYRALPGVDLVVPNNTKYRVLEAVTALLAGAAPAPVAPDVFGYHTADRTLRTRSMLKIQDGCNSFCSYCIVPYTRGRATSRPAAAVLANARELLAAGFRELVLTGVNMSAYRDGETGFAALVRMLLALPGEYRLRIASVEPEGLDESLFALFADARLCRHLHLCLQSGSDAVLGRMGRKYTAAGFLALAEGLKNRFPDFNLTTDVIVGFPGETEEDFTATLELVGRIGFSHVHTFAFSARKGTRAAGFPEQLPEAVKQERSERLRRLAAELGRTARAALAGREQTVLVERVDSQGLARGYSELYHPFRFPGDATMQNTFVRVRATGLTADGEVLLGEPLAAERP